MDESVKVAGGVAAGLGSNVAGIPLDRFRIMVAQDAAMATPLAGHFRTTMSSLSAAFTGGVARIAMKGTAASLNLFTPQEMRDTSPFLSNFVCGLTFAPVLNAPRMLQLAKINGESYGSASRRLFTTAAGWRTFAQNTALFAPGEALRMMMCFGTKDFLKPLVSSSYSEPATDAGSVLRRAAWLSAMVGPMVSVVETSAALATETASTVHAQLSAVGAGGLHPQEARTQVLASVLRPQYISRCWLALLTKNMAANTITFFFMFWADEYGAMRLAVAKEGGAQDGTRSSPVMPRELIGVTPSTA